MLIAWTCNSDAQTIKVLVIDTGIFEHKDFKSQIVKHAGYDEDYIDDHGHGTHIAGIVMKNVCPQVQLSSCKYLIPGIKSEDLMKRLYNCYNRAIKEKVDIINYSSSGLEPDEKEFELIKRMRNIVFVTSAGNNGYNLKVKPEFPAMYDLLNVVAVGNLIEKNVRNPMSNYGLKDMEWEVGTNIWSTIPNNQYKFMSGTSQATATHTNRLLKQRCKELNK